MGAKPHRFAIWSHEHSRSECFSETAKSLLGARTNQKIGNLTQFFGKSSSLR